MSKILFLLDPGHGDYVNGKNYSKQGKYSPKFDKAMAAAHGLVEGERFYEGHNNRDNARRIMELMKQAGLECMDVTQGSPEDVPLDTRVALANKLHSERPCVYISIHSDALGNGEEWNDASGLSVYTSKGQTESDLFATETINRMKKHFGTDAKWRKDLSDGDEDKEENFYVLKNTKCPAILIEAGFHTNKAEVVRMMSDAWKNNLAQAVTEAAVAWSGAH